MASKRSRFVAGFTVILTCCSVGLASAVALDEEIISQSESEITFRVRVPDFELRPITVDGISYTEVYASGLVPFAQEGRPNLPVVAVTLAVPPGRNARVLTYSRSDEYTLGDIRIAPVPRLVAVGEGAERFPDYVYAEDPEVYGAGAFPARAVWLADRGILRHQDIVKVVIAPFVYEPARSRLTVSRDITVTVGLEGGTTLGRAPVGEGSWENVYKDVLMNYEQSRRWRTARAIPLRSRTVGNDRVKILIDETGVYSVSFETLSSLGFPSGVLIEEVFLYRDGFRDGTPDTLETAEIAIDLRDNDDNGFLSEGDEIQFYARDFYDEFGYQNGEDVYFDKNAYWLSWGPGDHRRIRSREGWRDAGSPLKPDHFNDFIHVEDDSMFVNFPPNGDVDYFVWRVSSSSIPFDVIGIDTAYACSLIVGLVNYFNEPSGLTKTGRVDVFAWGCEDTKIPIGSAGVYAPGVTKPGFRVPTGTLCEGRNVFRFESTLHPSPGTTLDWFEVLYERKYEAFEDVLGFTGGGQTGEIELEVAEFSCSDIVLLDITDPSYPVTVEIRPDKIVEEDGAYKFTFRDSVGVAAAYIALCSASVRELDAEQVSLEDPPRLRDISGDYIVISHPDFLSELDPLIAKRQQQGFQVVTATSEEVYNDFGNGMKSDVAIRRFVENCYHLADAQFVLLVGDANVDRRGLLLSPELPPPAGQQPSDVDYLPSHNLLIPDAKYPNNEIRPDDNWFVRLDGPGDIYPDLYVGRLSAGSTEEAAAMVTKILNYEDYEGEESWKKRILLLADDEYKIDKQGNFVWRSSEVAFGRACDSVAVIARDFAVVAPETVKYYLKRCTDNDQPEKRANREPIPYYDAWQTISFTRTNCTLDATGQMKAGALIVNYQGHANREQFTHEVLIRDLGSGVSSYMDVRNLNNLERPFIFNGYGCWISDFQFRAEPNLGDAIGEKFITNTAGAACASFASSCGEYIDDNEVFNPFVTRAMFTHLQGVDLQGNPIPARVLLGEVMMTALVRFNLRGHSTDDYLKKHVLLGDPAMIIDMGPPIVSVTVDGSPIDETYVYGGGASEGLEIAADVRDEEAITLLRLDIAEDGTVTPIPEEDYSSDPLVDHGFERSRAYLVGYTHVPMLGEYAVRLTGEDYSGKVRTFDIQIATGSCDLFADERELAEGDTLRFDEDFSLLLTRPDAFGADDIEITVDGIPATEFSDYTATAKDGEGKEWEVSFTPVLYTGQHTLVAAVHGLAATKRFEYAAANIDFFVDSRALEDGDSVYFDTPIRIIIEAGAEVTQDSIVIDTGGKAYSASFAEDPPDTWTVLLTPLQRFGESTVGIDVRGTVRERDYLCVPARISFFSAGRPLAEGDPVYPQMPITVVAAAQAAVTADSIAVALDEEPIEVTFIYSGTAWEGTFVPPLDVSAHGIHALAVEVRGLTVELAFDFVPAEIRFSLDGRSPRSGDYVDPDALFEIEVETEADITSDSIEVTLNALPDSVLFVKETSDTAATVWRGMLPLDLPPGHYDLTVTVLSVSEAIAFEIAGQLLLLDVYPFPNPFSGETYFTYRLTEDAREVEISIFTVSGRKIFSDTFRPFPEHNYNEYMWDGRDTAGDRVPNGTYIYRLVVRSDSDEQEFTGVVVKIE
jgi:hypothetical protein